MPDIQNFTVRLDAEMRKKLKFIADREVRPMSNQAIVFLRESINHYAEEHNINFDGLPS